jgi:hypothetical protein
MSEPCCDNCRYMVDAECHRHAPPAYDFLRFYELELLRDIAWSVLCIARRQRPDEQDDVATLSTEAFQTAAWPDIEPSDWCGEFEKKPEAPREAAA